MALIMHSSQSMFFPWCENQVSHP